MKFLDVISVLGQVGLAAVGAIVILSGLILTAAIFYPPLLAPVLFEH